MNIKNYTLATVVMIFATFSIHAQNVGIGENDPQQKLHIDGADAGLQTVRIEDCAVSAAGTNDGELTTTNSTSDKAVYADSDGDLRVRYIYGDNVQSTIITGATQNIPESNSFTDINGASITFTPRHSVVYLSFAISGYNPLGPALESSSWLIVEVENGGVSAGSFLNLSANYDDTAGVGGAGPGASGAATVSAGNYPLTVTPGVPVTIKLGARAGGVKASNGFDIDKANFTSYMTIWD